MAIGLREKLTGYGLFLGALSAILTAAKLYAVAAGLVLWLSATLIAAFWIEDARRRPQLKRLFAPRRIGALYRRMTIRVARWPRDWQLYSKALLIAVIYPIGIPLFLWVYRGKAAFLGGVEVLPRPETVWQQLVVGGYLGLSILALLICSSAVKKGTFGSSCYG
ncbi:MULTISPECIES: hypothetical protein [Mameliella]|uniref:hypothetical protein n=1 Tax=Mameliella TaxID=1434019 RepID=UPI000B532573|nr:MULTISPECIES: hypothetical protein [Mameliella]MCR9275821.1 hypothetical protein [Paracoccaceae bacterium]OWV60033.1 hypothetical protein CDZ98_09305 [Mameliella alba]